jgi:AcrR family transcriptional regulator
MLAAFRLFGRQGYARTSIQDIAGVAGVKKPIVYYYFASKEALYQALLSESATRMHALLGEVLCPLSEASCEERLCALAETMLTLARDNQDPVRFFFAHAFAPDADRPGRCCQGGADDGLAEAPRDLLRWLAEEGLRSGEIEGDPDDLERLILGCIQFSILKHLRSPAQEPLAPGLGRRIVRAAMDGLRPRHARVVPDFTQPLTE